MINRASLSIAFAVIFLFLAPAAQTKMLFGPYLQSLAPDTISVCAFVNEGDAVNVRLIASDEKSREFAAVGSSPACARMTGLLPDVEYGYELFINGRRATGEKPLLFVANPVRDQTYVIYGDTRSGDDSFDLAHRQVVKAILESFVPDAIIHTGDFVERGDDQALWDNFFQIERELLSTTPVFPSIGQSDQPPALMRRIFPVLADAPWYSFDRGEVHVAVLYLWQERSQPADEVSADGAQARWLRDDLAEARSRGAEYLFVMMHEPAIDIEGKSAPAAREVFMPIFEAFHVTAVFSGAHYFSHAVRGGVHYFTNGGGGAVLDTRTPGDGVFRLFSAVHHFLVLEIGRMGARIIAVDAHGDEFYMATFAESPTGVREPFASTFVSSFSGGALSVPMTIFSRHGCEDCESFNSRLPDIAARTGATLVVTFRSLDDANNRAVLQALTDRGGPTPIVVIGDDVLIGLEEIESRLDGEIKMVSSRQGEKGLRSGRLIVVAGIFLAAAILLGALLSITRKMRTR